MYKTFKNWEFCILFRIFSSIELIHAERLKSCELLTGVEANSFVFPQPMYRCHNYTELPKNLPKEAKTLKLKGKILKLKTGELATTNLLGLEALVLTNISLIEIEVGTFKGENKLTDLHLEYNLIPNLNLSVFEDVPTLKELFLFGNPLKQFPINAEFPRMNLSKLNLGKCGLQFIPQNLFRNLVNLTYISISENSLSTLDWIMFRPLRKLNNVEMWENPFHCDCKMKFLFDYLNKTKCWSWSYRVKCNSEDNKNSSIGSENLRLSMKEEDRKLLICPAKVTSLQSRKPEKGKITFECEYSGYPKPIVTWTKDGKLFTGNKTDIIDEALDGTTEMPEFNLYFKQTLSVLDLLEKDQTNINYNCQVI